MQWFSEDVVFSFPHGDHHRDHPVECNPNAVRGCFHLIVIAVECHNFSYRLSGDRVDNVGHRLLLTTSYLVDSMKPSTLFGGEVSSFLELDFDGIAEWLLLLDRSCLLIPRLLVFIDRREVAETLNCVRARGRILADTFSNERIG